MRVQSIRGVHVNVVSCSIVSETNSLETTELSTTRGPIEQMRAYPHREMWRFRGIGRVGMLIGVTQILGYLNIQKLLTEKM